MVQVNSQVYKMENRRGRKQGTTNKVMDMDEDCRIEMRFEIVEG